MPVSVSEVESSVDQFFRSEARMRALSAPPRWARGYYRDLGCVLWLFFERAELRDHRSLTRVGALKRLALEESRGVELLESLIYDVLEQQSQMKKLSPLGEMAKELGLNGAARHMHMFIRMCMTSIDGIARLLMMPIWAEYAFPTVQLSHKLAAALMVTRMSAEVLDSFEMPFPVIEIELPTGMFHTMVETSPKAFEAKEILSVHAGGIWAPCTEDEGYFERGFAKGEAPMRYAMLANAGSCALWSVQYNLQDLGTRKGCGSLFDSSPDAKLDGISFDLAIDDCDDRVMAMIARLYIGAALMMLTPSNRKAIGKSHGNSVPAEQTGRRRTCPLPVNRVFQLTQPVRHDFREVVREYVRGGGRSPNVQGMVAPHMKMQPYGPKGALRRRTFIESYWRGPEDAPIAIRPHRYK